VNTDTATTSEPTSESGETTGDTSGNTSPSDDGEAHLFVAYTGDTLHIARVAAKGEVSLYGPPLDDAQPPVLEVGRMLQSDNAERVLVQDNTSHKTHALREGKWEDFCADMGAQYCSATSPNPELTTLMLNRSYNDPAGDGAVLITYEGDVKTPDSVRTVYHSPDGWIAFVSVVDHVIEFFLLREDDTIESIERLPLEMPQRAFGEHLLTYSNDYSHLWFRQPMTNAREEVLCPDESLPKAIIVNRAAYERCADDLFVVGDGLFQDTGNDLIGDFKDARPLYVEPGRYTFAQQADWPTLTAQCTILDPNGTLIASEVRAFKEVDGWVSYPLVHVYGWSATDDRLAAYVSFRLMGLAHTDVTLSEEHGIFVWREGQPASWFELDQAPTNDLAASPVWFPESAENVFWVTSDGRLMGFDYALQVLEDRSGDLVFQPFVY